MSKSKYRQLIEDYCNSNDVQIPVGFYRNSVGHFVIIKNLGTSKKLVATTWFKTSDVINYLTNYTDVEYQIFDFKNYVELNWNGGKSLEKIGVFK